MTYEIVPDPKAGDTVFQDWIFLSEEKEVFREKYILRVHYYFFKKITSNNLKLYKNKLFLINNNWIVVNFLCYLRTWWEQTFLFIVTNGLPYTILFFSILQR